MGVHIYKVKQEDRSLPIFGKIGGNLAASDIICIWEAEDGPPNILTILWHICIASQTEKVSPTVYIYSLIGKSV